MAIISISFYFLVLIRRTGQCIIFRPLHLVVSAGIKTANYET